jgi:hypothetical protein
MGAAADGDTEGRRGLGLKKKKGRRKKKGAARALMSQRCRARRGGAAAPGPRLAGAPRLASVAPLPRRRMWRGKGWLPRHAARHDQQMGHRVQIMFAPG